MVTTIRGPIAGTVNNDGDLVIKGDVAVGAGITVTNGSLKIEGNVGDHVTLHQGSSSGPNVNVSRDGNIVQRSFGKNSPNIISKGGVHITFGDDGDVVINTDNSANRHSGVTVKGNIGNGVHVETDGTFKANIIGENAVVIAGDDIKAALVKARAVLTAGDDIKISECSDPSATLTAQGKTKTGVCRK